MAVDEVEMGTEGVEDEGGVDDVVGVEVLCLPDVALGAATGVALLKGVSFEEERLEEGSTWAIGVAVAVTDWVVLLEGVRAVDHRAGPCLEGGASN